MRVSRDGGRSYRRRYQQPVSYRLPNQPAAVMTFDRCGRTRLICLDLDSSRGDVDVDHAHLTHLLDGAGLASWFSDHSPNGGRHVYVPLLEPVAVAEAAAVVRALAGYAPTLDVAPMVNADSGCIRPPGSRHRTGGFQALDGPLDVAVSALEHPNPPEGWARLARSLSVALAPTDAPLAHATAALGSASTDRTRSRRERVDQLEPLHGFTAPDPGYQHIARTGEYDPGRYRSPSEARQGVVWSCVAAGWAFTDVVRRLEDATWAGLASFYDRYTDRHAAVVRDWRAATAFEKQRRQQQAGGSVRTCTTSPRKSQRGVVKGGGRSVNQDVREWLAAVDMLTGHGTDLSIRAVLYALAEAAVLTGSMVVEHGNRHLAIAAGKTTGGHTTVGRILKDLADAPADRLLIDLVRPAQGVRANTYQLVIPGLLRPACQAQPWRRGRIYGIRPVFRELGLPAAFVYAVLEQLDAPLSGREVAALARIGHTATADALRVLATWGLAERTPDGWIRGTASLGHLAEAWGLVEAIREQIAHYRTERAAWLRWLIEHNLIADPTTSRAPPPPDPPPDPWWLPPPDDLDQAETVMTILERILGARTIHGAA